VLVPVIDPDWSDVDDYLGYSLETFVVIGDFDQNRRPGRPGARKCTPPASGSNGAENLDSVEAAATSILLPSYVSDPRITERGIEVHVDGDGATDPPMAAALPCVLRQ
jgi:hypothetical protein